MKKELEIKKEPRERILYIGVNYYRGDIPYAILYDSREHAAHSDEIYTVVIPYKKFKSKLLNL